LLEALRHWLIVLAAPAIIDLYNPPEFTEMAHDHARLTAVSRNPANDETLGEYPYLNPDEIEALLADAAQGFAIWSRTDVAARADRLHRIGDLLEQRTDPLSRLITAEMGKPISASRTEVAKCAALCRWYADNLAALLSDEAPDVGGDGHAIVSFLPLGTVLGVMPWNFPLWQVLRAAIPIMAAGNGFLLKHADNVQGCAAALGSVFVDADLPTGTFAVANVHRTALADLIAHPQIAAVTVTAGVAAGRAVAAEAGRHLKKTVLELGGSDPFIVLADADLDRAVEAAITARFQNGGQVCIAAKRIIVEEPIAAVFTRRFVEAARTLVSGDPFDPATRLGPLARRRAREELHQQVEQSCELGARRLLGGIIPAGPGAYYPATVLADVTPDMAVFRSETFGPVAAIVTASDAIDAVRLANNSEFGLSGAIWSKDIDRASALAREVATGGVFVNGVAASDPRVPIGGIKQSGYGRELSHFGLREFCNAQLRWVRN
jgi:succinate-semialdehyde dehydrogenase